MESCSLHRPSPATTCAEVLWGLTLRPGQQGFFLCEAGDHYVLVVVPSDAPGIAERISSTLFQQEAIA